MIKNTNVIKINSLKPVINFQPKRGMIRSKLTQVPPMHLSKPIFKGQISRGLPVSAVEYTKPTSSEGHELDNKHVLIQDVESKKIVAALTSKKFNHLHEKNERISDVKYDGSFTPATEKDFKPKKYIMDDYGFKIVLKNQKPKILMDDYGYTIPSKTAGGQHLRPFQRPQEVVEPKLLKKAPQNAQDFVNAHTKIIEEHVEASGVLKKDSIKIK